MQDGDSNAGNTGPDARRRGRAARRAGVVPTFDTSVPSPCISVCQIDARDGLCIGCLRSLDEIRDWPVLSATEKRAVLARLEARRGDAGRPPDRGG